MVQITLAINGLLDQQVGLRPGGLYWLSIDQLADAKILARQFLAALEQSVPATLITCAHSPQSFINELPADCGPGKLRLFEITPQQIAPALETLPRELGRIGIAPSSVLLLILPASHWGEKTSAHKLQRWCERMRPWLRERQATLLLITHGEAEHLHSKLLTLNEQLSGLSRLYRFNGDIRYQLHFWHTEQGVSAGQELKLRLKHQTFELIAQSLAEIQPRVADDQHVYLVERAVLEGSPSLTRHWYLFETREALLKAARSAVAATVVVGIDNSHQLLELAQQLHTLREHCGPALKIVVREMEPAVRYRDERLLLACGANLIVPDRTLLSRFLSMIDSIQGQLWQYTQSTDFQTLLKRQRPPQIRGLVSPQTFFTTLEQIYAEGSGEVTHQLMRLRPAEGLDSELFLGQMCLRRYGDIACLLDGWLYLFLFACRADGLEPALGNICRLPWRDMFSQRQMLSGITELFEAQFINAPAQPAHWSIPVEHLDGELRDAGSLEPLTPERCTLPLSEPTP